ncbi:nuclear transcription factor Y subunit B-1-like [Salvia divinorum]|uniref:Nuclear transcription factor Y subunit B-1-like n=1 Tax=Salvia divinorum TaxID=28513 RepID=A0ABD1HJK9_SALDI
MESGGRFNSHHVASRSEGGAAAGGGGEKKEAAAVQQGPTRRSGEYMPVANVTRIMRRALPPNAKIADDAKETIQECVTEFIAYVTTEANSRCHGECRKTITPEDVVGAMEALGFHNYSDTLSLFLSNYRAQDPLRRPMQPARGRGAGGGGGSGSGGGGEGSSSGAEFEQFNLFK